MDDKLLIFWESETHRGVIKRLHGTSADGVVCELGVWASATEIKTGKYEHTLPYASVDAAIERLAEKYIDFRVVAGNVDVVAAVTEQQ